MSYSSIVKIPVSYTDGTPLFSVDVPLEDMVDTVVYRAYPVWSDMVDVALQKLMPAIRKESETATTQVYDKAKSVSLKAGAVMGSLVGVAILGGVYLWAKSRRG